MKGTDMSKHEDFEYIRDELVNLSFILDSGTRKDYITTPKVKKLIKTIIHYGNIVYSENFINTDKRYKNYQKLINIYKNNHKNLIPKLPEILKICDFIFPTIETQWNEKPIHN